MTTYTATFPLRTVQLQLQDKEQTPLEAEAFTLYGNLHNDLFELKMHWLNCIEKTEEQVCSMQICEAAYLEMETEIRRYGKMAGHADVDDTLVPEGAEYTLKPAHLQSLIDTLTASINDYNTANTIIWDLYTTAAKRQEAFDKAFTRFNKISYSPIIANYDEVQVDTISFDRDFNQFREYCCEICDLQEKFTEIWEAQKPAQDEMQNKMVVFNKHIAQLNRGLYMLDTDNFSDQNPDLN